MSVTTRYNYLVTLSIHFQWNYYTITKFNPFRILINTLEPFQIQNRKANDRQPPLQKHCIIKLMYYSMYHVVVGTNIFVWTLRYKRNNTCDKGLESRDFGAKVTLVLDPQSVEGHNSFFTISIFFWFAII